ncbi:MAG: hypothetical protein WCW36_02115 [Candidatus Paceibacterota bacterium]|jgi:hypothetical protein
MKIKLAYLVAVLAGISAVVFLLSVREDDKPISTVDLSHVSANKAKIEPCRKTPAICGGGFVIDESDTREYFKIKRIRAGCLNGDYCLDVLLRQTDEHLGNMKIVLHGETEWGQTAIDHSLQFVPK